MLIGSEFNKKSRHLLKKAVRLSEGDTDKKVTVQRINEELGLDRTEIRNILEYLGELGLIETVTIGGPLLYTDIRITDEGIKKAAEF